MTVEVAAAAVVRHGRVLAARRVSPVEVAGGWELPGGKVDPGESAAAAVVREVREELACDVRVVSSLPGRAAIRPGYELTVHVAEIVGGSPVPHEHDAWRWLGPEELDELPWLASNRPFLPELRQRLLSGDRLPGGNVGGAVRIGSTVRRETGPWTPAVHALMRHARSRGVPCVPPVLGFDELGREVLGFLPGRLIDVGSETVSDGLLVDAFGWLRRFHAAVASFSSVGPWRIVDRPLQPGEIVAHGDFAPYNVAVSSSATGERVVGVFDWDIAGPATVEQELAWAAWHWVPLLREQPPADQARRLALLAEAYGGTVAAVDILGAVQQHMQWAVEVITEGQRAGDPGMLNLARVGEPENTISALDRFVRREPRVRQLLEPTNPRRALRT